MAHSRRSQFIQRLKACWLSCSRIICNNFSTSLSFRLCVLARSAFTDKPHFALAPSDERCFRTSAPSGLCLDRGCGSDLLARDNILPNFASSTTLSDKLRHNFCCGKQPRNATTVEIYPRFKIAKCRTTNVCCHTCFVT